MQETALFYNASFNYTFLSFFCLLSSDMETKSTSFVSRTRRWMLQKKINKEFLQSVNGALKVSEMVSKVRPVKSREKS